MKIPHANNPEIERRFPSDAPSEWRQPMHEEFDAHWHERPRKSGWQRLIIAALCFAAAGMGIAAIAGAGL